jgi:hypothetical protein
MAQLLIQNKGVAPTEAYTLMGASLSRDNAGLIGQFGSGAKLAITTLLRKGLKVTIYCGLTRMEFKTRTIEIKDGIECKQQERVYVQYGGTSKRKEDLGWVLGMGAMDWEKDTTMAIREFIANAIDYTVKQGANVRDAHMDRDLAVEIVQDDFKRAQDGYTRVFIEADEDCQNYVDELPRRFLHFSSNALGRSILPKLSDRKKAQIYYNGVFVRELSDSADSICDYNFTGDQIKIDESRNLDEYQARASIGRLYRDAGVDDLVRLFKALSDGLACLETGLDGYYIKPNSWDSGNDARKERWQEAWARVNGENTVACGSNDGIVGDFARRKGYDLGVMQDAAWVDTVKEYGVPTVGDVLDSNERRGRTLTPPTFEAIDAVSQVWEWVSATDLLPEECEKPMVKGFDEITNAESDCLGFYKPGTKEVYLRNDLGGEILLETALEEVAHYITGATDCSRDFQNFLMRLFIRWMR